MRSDRLLSPPRLPVPALAAFVINNLAPSTRQAQKSLALQVGIAAIDRDERRIRYFFLVIVGKYLCLRSSPSGPKYEI